jgi:thiosulfate/3-mercaptopyruvate sulfurtransferase
MPTFTTLISVADFHAQLTAPTTPLRVFDCTFDLMNPSTGAAQFAQSHIPSAQHADLDHDLSAHGGSVAAGTAASGGRHPLPTRDAFAQWLSRHGIDAHTQVVVYDRNGVNYCGRLWWLLKWCGHEAVAVLDGGLQAWQAAGHAVVSTSEYESKSALAQETPAVAATHFELKDPLVQMVNTATVQSALGRAAVLDARAAPRFRGEVEPLDPIAGHIPGALNRPFPSNFGPDGRFKSSAQLRQEFTTLLAGRDPSTVIHHCGSGVSAVPNVLAMELAGLGRQALYAGSWSEWSNTPGLPVAQG